MSSVTKLTMGRISYLNCVPFYHYLEQSGFQGEYITGVPSELNRLLQDGKLDISPSSSFEYARNWRDYLLLPGHSISAVSQVKSVLLFSPVPLSELSGRKVSVTGESATSVNLLRIILREFYNLHDVTDIVPEGPVETLIEQQQPALLIGDRALLLAEQLPCNGMHIYDLATIWHQHTGLPFVFALWMISRNALDCHTPELISLKQQLNRSYEKLMQTSKQVASLIAGRVGLEMEMIVDYWQTIDYRLEKEHLSGLQLFFKLCHKYNLLIEEPKLDFFDDQWDCGMESRTL